MDKKSYMNFKTLLISRLNNENKLSDTQIQKVLNTLFQIRKKPEFMMNFFGNNYNYNNRDSEEHTLFKDCTYQLWFPGCGIIYTLISIFVIVLYIQTFIVPTCEFLDTCGWTCSGPSWCLAGCGLE
jgi:hypothetical protein